MGVTLKPFQVSGIDFVDMESIGHRAQLPIMKLLHEGQEQIPEKMRCTEEEVQGQFTSIMLAAFNGTELIGAVSISQINLVNQVDDLLEVSAIVSPYFPDVADELGLVRDLFLRLFHQPLDLANGQQIAILDTMAYRRLKIFDNSDPMQVRIQGVIGKIDEAADQVQVQDDPDDVDREIVTARKVAS